ncbi:multi-sensor signal transduction multi-kinase [Nitzschia inconspicua]|uniref:Multi-sensor signal transduction multi-kinase n=1 Tax=Nitzschia inconspicua TaxID=303405 RepID=A0A9K3M5Z5_9STRA|nr:multi-sensor signal transduction multi-kinase [Nitzschia inconspicua]
MTLETEIISSNSGGRSNDAPNHSHQHHDDDHFNLKDTCFAFEQANDATQSSPEIHKDVTVTLVSPSVSPSSFPAQSRRRSSRSASFRLPSKTREGNEQDKGSSSTDFLFHDLHEEDDSTDGEIYVSSELFAQIQQRLNTSSTRTSNSWEVRQVDLHRETVTAWRRSSMAVLDGLTVNKLQFDKMGLHGREEETKLLQGVWDSVHQQHAVRLKQQQEQEQNDEGQPTKVIPSQEKQQNSTSVVPVSKDPHETASKRFAIVNNKILTIVEGLSGAGKSRLVSAVLKKQVQRKRAYFVVGKFDMKQFDEPFKGIIMAMEDLCDQLLGDAPVDSSGSLHMTTAISNTTIQESVDRVDIKELLLQGLELELPFLVTFLPKLQSLASYDGTAEGTDAFEESNEITRCDHLPTAAVDDVAGGKGGIIHIKGSADRLKHCVRKFIQIICSVSPLVIHLDDTHWADTASLDLLYQILTDTSNQDALMVVCSYRSNEIKGEHHPMTDLVSKISDFSNKTPFWSVPIHRITVENLSVEALDGFLQDLLSGDSNETSELAQILYDKTRGNIFFTNQVLIALHKQGLLEYSLGAGKWIWNAQTILEEAPPGDNVVDLVKEKLLKDTGAMQLLAIAACLGSHFSRYNLILVVDGIRKKSHDSTNRINNARLLYTFLPLDFDVNALIQHCHQEEYIRPTAANDGFHFFHDRIQEAALSVLPDQVFFLLKYEVGRVLAAKLPEEQLEAMVFIVLGLLSDGRRRPPEDREDKLAILKLYMIAGHKAATFSAFKTASKHFQSAIELLPDDCWQSQHDLTLILYSAAAEAEYAAAKFESMKELCDKILKEPSVSPTNKLKISHVLIDVAVTDHKPGESMQVARSLLKDCGVKIPQGDLRIAFSSAIGLARTKFSRKMKDPDTIAKIPLTHNEADAQIMKTLDHLATAAYVGKPEFFPVVVLKSIQYTFDHGITVFSPAAFALIGLLLTCFLDDFAAGWKFASNGIAMLKRIKCKDVEARTIFVAYTYCAHWIRPMKDCMKFLFQGYKIGLSTGDILSAMYCAHFWCECALYTGMPLVDVDSNIASYGEQMKDFGQSMILSGLKMVHQSVRILRGKAGHNDGTGAVLTSLMSYRLLMMNL